MRQQLLEADLRCLGEPDAGTARRSASAISTRARRGTAFTLAALLAYLTQPQSCGTMRP